MSPVNILVLPAPVREALEQLERELVEKLGDTLSSLIVYGSVASGAYRDGQSDVDLAIVLTKGSREKLVFMIEARPELADAPRLRSGQPLDVRLASNADTRR